VAGITEQDGGNGSVGASHLQNGYGVVNRTSQRNAASQQIRDIGFAIIAAIYGEGGVTSAMAECGVSQICKCGFAKPDRSFHHQVRVLPHQFFLFGFDWVIIDQVISQSRSAVVVGEREQHLVALQSMVFSEQREDAIASSRDHEVCLPVRGETHIRPARRVFPVL